MYNIYHITHMHIMCNICVIIYMYMYVYMHALKMYSIGPDIK